MWLDNLTTQLGVVGLLKSFLDFIILGKNLPQHQDTEKRNCFKKLSTQVPVIK